MLALDRSMYKMSQTRMKLNCQGPFRLGTLTTWKKTANDRVHHISNSILVGVLVSRDRRRDRRDQPHQAIMQMLRLHQNVGLAL